MSQHAAKAQQGHIYKFGEKRVMVIETTGHSALVRELDAGDVCPLGDRHTVKASWLTPLPMVYFHGEVPA